MATKAERIALLNDVLRATLTGGRVMMTRSVAALPDDERFAVIDGARRFTAFNDDNDPYGEHDCASFEAAGRRCLFKIDYYDPDMKHGSHDRADPTRTCRVLTIMLAEDY